MEEIFKMKNKEGTKGQLNAITSQINCDLSANYECLEGESPLTLLEPDDLKETMSIISKRENDHKAIQDSYVFNQIDLSLID